jgi:hypothetical protein
LTTEPSKDSSEGWDFSYDTIAEPDEIALPAPHFDFQLDYLRT